MVEIDKKDLFLAKPYNMKIWHIFGKDHRSLCGKVAMLFVDPEQCDKVKGTEIYQKGQDCKACFKKAGLKLE